MSAALAMAVLAAAIPVVALARPASAATPAGYAAAVAADSPLAYWPMADFPNAAPGIVGWHVDGLLVF